MNRAFKVQQKRGGERLAVRAVMKRVLWMMVPAGIILAVVLTFYHRLELAEDRRRIAAEEISRLELLEAQLRKDLKDVFSDLDYLRATIQFELRALKLDLYATPDYTQRLFLHFSQAKIPYEQIRLLSDRGMEYLRVNYNEGEPYLVPDSQLQDKSERYYFKEAIRLAPGELYISPLDLNVENGAVQHPETPMLRFGMALFDALNEPAGVVVINYKGDYLLENVRQAQRRTSGNLLLVNADGFYLAHPEREKCWGFMYPARSGYTLAKEYPACWERLSGERGQFFWQGGLATYRRVVVGGGHGHTQRVWRLVSLLDPAAYASLQHDDNGVHVIIFSVMMALMSVVSVGAALSMERRRLMQAEVMASERRFRRLSGQLEESNAIKELLLDVLSHDLQNPAGQIDNAAEMLLDELPEDEWAQLIRGSCDHLQKVVFNAKTLSCIVAGEQIERGELNLTELVAGVLEELHPALETMGFQVEVELPELLVVQANPIVEEVFKNFVTNVMRYADEGKRLRITAVRGEGVVRLNFADWGTTIAEENREAIFLRRVQLKSGSKVGSGLGLAIVKRIAVMHRAKVGVRPNVPHGNVFYLEIPVRYDPDDSALNV